MLRFVAFAAALGIGAGQLRAEPINEQTSCRTITQIFEAEDRARTAEVMTVLEKVYVSLDTAGASRGRTKIFERMNDDGKVNTMAMATSMCGERPSSSLGKTAREAYEALYSMGKGIGAYK